MKCHSLNNFVHFKLHHNKSLAQSCLQTLGHAPLLSLTLVLTLNYVLGMKVILLPDGAITVVVCCVCVYKQHCITVSGNTKV